MSDVIVVDEHGDCLRGISNSQNWIQLIAHFDSHPDMDSAIFPEGVMREIENGDLSNAQPFVDVATWMLPVILAKRTETVFWIKPTWSDQLPVGNYSLTLTTSRNKIFVHGNIDKTYWELSQAWGIQPGRVSHNFTLIVTEDLPAADQLMSSERRLLFDIDEDYFSCENPSIAALEAFLGASAVVELRSIFSTESTDDPKFLEAVTRYISQGVYKCKSAARVRHPSVTRLLKHLSKKQEQVLCKYCRELSDSDVYTVDEIGRFVDMFELPQHISKIKEVGESMNAVFNIFQQLVSYNPLVVVSQSVTDGYTPASQAPFIHRAVLDRLSDAYPCAAVVLPSMLSCFKMSTAFKTFVFEQVEGEITRFIAAVAHNFTATGVLTDCEDDEEIPWEAIRWAGDGNPPQQFLDDEGYERVIK